jgi:hypothetical protein
MSLATPNIANYAATWYACDYQGNAVQQYTGRPCSSQTFFDNHETLLQKDVKPQKRGRKSKLKETDD